MADTIKTLGPYAAVLAALITGLTVSVQWRIVRRAQQQDEKRKLFAEAYEACIEYAEMPYAVRRRRTDAAAEERIRLSEQLREIQIKLARFEAWVRFESPEVGAVYDALVTRTRETAGRSIKGAWLADGASADSAIIIPTSVVDLRELNEPRERYMAAVEAHLRPQNRRARLVAYIPRPRRRAPLWSASQRDDHS
ncbi:hypothetical protein ABZX30_17645 [Streptomyces sp. NPDC004542]|uniref:hypothetical protein n=1 Tax=Streptomyces sp. NPDC004542 TaxID=3154281 RepID=UPI0033BF0634